jgi:hypothetical protein
VKVFFVCNNLAYTNTPFSVLEDQLELLKKKIPSVEAGLDTDPDPQLRSAE